MHVSQRAPDAAGQQGERHRAAPGETQRPAAAHGELQRHQLADGRDGQQCSRSVLRRVPLHAAATRPAWALVFTNKHQRTTVHFVSIDKKFQVHFYAPIAN